MLCQARKARRCPKSSDHVREPDQTPPTAEGILPSASKSPGPLRTGDYPPARDPSTIACTAEASDSYPVAPTSLLRLASPMLFCVTGKLDVGTTKNVHCSGARWSARDSSLSERQPNT